MASRIYRFPRALATSAGHAGLGVRRCQPYLPRGVPMLTTSRSHSARQGKAVELKVPAELDQLLVVRGVAEALAVLEDFNLDEVADITLAVDEVCAQLAVGASKGADLRCIFTLNDTELSAAVSVLVAEGFELPRDGFGWHVLETVADSLSVEEPAHRSTDADREITVRITKRRSGSAGLAQVWLTSDP